MSALSKPANFTSTGGLILATGGSPAPVMASGKRFTDDGKMSATTNVPLSITWSNGLPFDDSGALVVVASSAAVGPLYVANGVLFSATGAVVCVEESAALAPVIGAQGLRFDASGAVLVSGLNFDISFTSGTLDPRISFTRASNATQFDSQGRLIWAPHNLLPNSELAGAGPGVPPTGWTLTSSAGVTVACVGTGTDAEGDYVEFSIVGTAGGSNEFPNIGFSAATAIDAGIGWSVTASTKLRRIITIPVTGSMGFNLIGRTTGGSTIGGQSTSAAVPEGVSSPVLSYTFTNATVGKMQLRYLFTVNAGTSVDERVRIYKATQLERADVNTPKTYNPTTGSAYYGPRFDYNSATLAPMGFLIEGQRTNLCHQSGHFGLITDWGSTNSASFALGSTYAGHAAFRYTGNGVAGGHFFNPPTTLSAPAASTAHTAAVRVCSSSNDLIQIATSTAFATAAVYVNFRFSTGTITAQGADVSNVLVEPCADGSFRVSFTFTTIAAPGAGAPVVLAAITTETDGQIPSNTFSGTLEAYGAQLEAATFASSDIPTTGATATRNRDASSISDISWWNTAGANSWMAEYIPMHIARAVAYPAVWQLSDGTTNNRFRLDCTSSQRAQMSNVIGGVATFSPAAAVPAQVSFVVQKSAGSIANLDIVLVDKANGGLVSSNTTYNVASALFNILHLGSNEGGGQPMFGWLRKLRFYPLRLSNAELQALVA